MRMLSIYFSVSEVVTLMTSFFVKGKSRLLSMFGKKYNSIPNDKVAGMDVNTLTGFCSLRENGSPL